jgi:hypothetical protein
MTMTVSEWGSLSSASIQRQDSTTKVGETSNVFVSFTVPYPVDTGCRLKIVFPDDMPVGSSIS